MATSSTRQARQGPAPAIGIDLGTTYSCVAVCEDGNVTIIKNDLGEVTTPSHIAFPDLTQTTTSGSFAPIIGYAAKHQVDINPEFVIYDVKRIIGTTYDDPTLQEKIQRLPFKVINENNIPKIVVHSISYHPEQISAKILVYLKKQAESHLGCKVTDAVITVPAYFNDGQRQATRHAGEIAGLNVLQIINEPTAAAIAYNHQQQKQTQPSGIDPNKLKNILIFDLGGGTFDLALLAMQGSNINVKAVDGDQNLGGQDFDNALVDHCIKEFKEKHHKDLSKPEADTAKAKFDVNKRLRRIKNECEQKKINLSVGNVAPIGIEAILGELDLKLKVRRHTFESINQPLFDKCLEIVGRILKEAKMKKEQIDEVILVGGSSRIPKIQEMLKSFFGGRAPCQNIKQDEAVAYGAAVQASQIQLSSTTSFSDEREHAIRRQNTSIGIGNIVTVNFSDVTPFAIGVEVYAKNEGDNDFSRIIDKSTKVPFKISKSYETVEENQKVVRISIYEGHSGKVKENHLLGVFHVIMPPKSPKGVRLDIQLEVDKEGILTVKAECPSQNVGNKMVVNELKARLKKEQVEEFRIQEMYAASS